MSDPITPQQFTRVAVVAFLAFAAVVAVIHSRQDKKVGVIVPVQQQDANTTSSELARCRTIKPDETAVLDSCQRVWAVNRKHFFAPARSTPAQISSSGAAVGPAKSQDRVTPVEAQSEAR
jgi:conjugative transfer region protein TrbK